MSNSFYLVDNVSLYFSKLPNIGRKTALKYALWCLSHKDDAINLSSSINEMINNVKMCKRCRNIADKDFCSICSDEKRDRDILCVVEDVESLMTIESSGIYHGTYFVLWGLISPLRGVGSNHVGIKDLVHLVKIESVNEIILVISANTEGDLTAQYIKEVFSDEHCKVTRIASGIPVGSNISFIDKDTLVSAFKSRSQI